MKMFIATILLMLCLLIMVVPIFAIPAQAATTTISENVIVPRDASVLVQAIIDTAVQLVKLVVTAVMSYYILPFIRSTAIPFLKEKYLYSTIRKLVMAAEKLGATGAIEKADKKKYVTSMLARKGVEATKEVEAYIESAVTELDHMVGESLCVLGEAVTAETVEE